MSCSFFVMVMCILLFLSGVLFLLILMLRVLVVLFGFLLFVRMLRLVVRLLFLRFVGCRWLLCVMGVCNGIFLLIVIWSVVIVVVLWVFVMVYCSEVLVF